MIEKPIIRTQSTQLMPTYKTNGSAGADLHASENHVIFQGESELIGTGVRIAIPNGYEGQVRPRSGLALKHGITVLNSPGTIDSDYRGEVKVLLVNFGDEDYQIKKGDRIAQLVIAPVTQGQFVPGLLDETDRGSGGFGSTGKS